MRALGSCSSEGLNRNKAQVTHYSRMPPWGTRAILALAHGGVKLIGRLAGFTAKSRAGCWPGGTARFWISGTLRDNLGPPPSVRPSISLRTNGRRMTDTDWLGLGKFDFRTILYHFDPFCGVGPGWSALGHGPPGASVAAWVLVAGLRCLVIG